MSIIYDSNPSISFSFNFIYVFVYIWRNPWADQVNGRTGCGDEVIGIDNMSRKSARFFWKEENNQRSVWFEEERAKKRPHKS